MMVITSGSSSWTGFAADGFAETGAGGCTIALAAASGATTADGAAATGCDGGAAGVAATGFATAAGETAAVGCIFVHPMYPAANTTTANAISGSLLELVPAGAAS
jgi:hypothetical protein